MIEIGKNLSDFLTTMIWAVAVIVIVAGWPFKRNK